MKWDKYLDHILLALVVGVSSIGVSFIGEMSKNMQQISASVQELNVRMSNVSDSLKDHETRLRFVEHTHERK